MKIIILGAGQVGSTLAQNLLPEDNDITVVDLKDADLRGLQDRMDLKIIKGHAAHPRVLAQAGARDAEMLIAVTNSDEVNMVACQVAYTLFNTPTRIARIRSADLLRHPELFKGEAVPIDKVISPEELITHHVKQLIEVPGALQVVDFAGGKVQLVAARTARSGTLVGNALKNLNVYPGGEVRVAAIFRGEQAIIPDGNTIVRSEDELVFLAARRDIGRVMANLQRVDKPARRVLLAGGGNIGRRLARVLERDHYVKIMERDEASARRLSEELDRAIVLVGDCADQNLLGEENIAHTDVYCALTNDDEANILSSMLAKRMGARRVMTLINRPAYADLIESGTIDVAISPQQITISALLTHLRHGHVVQVHTLRRGAAEAIEVVAHGHENESRVVGRKIEDLDLPSSATVGGVVRGDKFLIPHHDSKILSEDHVILFLTDRSQEREVEKLFQVSVTFI